MKFLVFNVGSETIKYAFYENEKFIEKKIIYSKKIEIIKDILKKFKSDYIIHRVVHGGEIKKECFIDKKIISKIENFSKFAPLHNPRQIETIKICQKYNSSRNIAVFDTSFFSTIPEKAKIYPIPVEISKKFKIKRYGFHGLSHESIAIKFPNKNIISCHLGSGCSVCAIKKGKALDISMGFTPLEGIMMVTRAGSIDPGIILMLVKEIGLKKTEEILNYKSGFYGLTGIEDLRKIKNRKNEPKNKLAIEIFCYSVAKQICSYQATLGKIDIVSFTGGIGEFNDFIRDKICSYLLFNFKKEIIKTDEEKLMLEKAKKLINLK